MHRIKPSLTFIGLCLAIITLLWVGPSDKELKVYPKNQVNKAYKDHEEKKYDQPGKAASFEFEKVRDPASGNVPAGSRMKAFQQTQKKLSKHKTASRAVSGVSWVERGPNNVGGRTRALVFDPNDPSRKRVWAGGVGGGLWFNEDITIPTSEWQNQDDFLANIAITSIAFDPSNHSNIYAATGEGWFNFDAIRGAGIWKSEDSGTTFTQLVSTNNSNFFYVQKVVVAANGDVFAATRNASIQRSTDGGATWSRVLNEGNTARAADIEIASNGDIYASLGIFSSPHIFRSTNNGDSWTEVTPNTTTSGRIELAIAPSASSSTASTVIYAVKHNASAADDNDVSWIRKSTNGGDVWSDLTIPLDFASESHFTRGQAWYNNIITVHPTNPDIVLMGGIDLFKTTDGGSNWTAISQWFGGNSNPFVHADQHNIVFRPDFENEAIFSNDGGVYYSPDAGSASSPNFSASNYHYNVTQFYSLAMENTAGENYFLAGAQDNGTHQFNFVGMNPTLEVTGGDGGFTFIDQDNPQIQITAFTNNNYFISLDGGDSFSDLAGSSNNGLFINPADYDSESNILYAAGDANNLERFTGIGATVSHSTINLSLSNQQISAVTVTDASSNSIYIGTSSGSVFRIDNADGTPSTVDISGIVNDQFGYVSSIALGANNSELLVTLSNFGVTSIFYSNDGGTTWTSKDESDHGLPDFPVRWALFNPNNTLEVLIATEQGVWSTDNIQASNPDWEPTNTGLANVRCDMLQYREADNLVALATHGRGLFTSDVFANPTAQFTAEKREWYVGVPLKFQDGSLKATSWAWDFDNDGLVDNTDQNPSHIFTSTGLKTINLTINGNSENSLTRTDYVNIIERPAIPYSTDFESDGSGFCSYLINSSTAEVWEWGAGTANKTNFNPSNSAETIGGNNNWMTSLDSHHGANTRYALETPPFSFLGGTDQYILSFDYRAGTGNGAGMNVEVSIDSGVTWELLGGLQGSDDNALQDWYNTSGIIGLVGANGWTGLSFFILNPQYDVSQFIGESDVRFRFVFGSRGAILDGFQVDNFEISGNSTSLPLIWDGSESADWSTATNWVGGVIPISTDDVIVPDASSSTFSPNIDEDITINQMTINHNGSIDISSGTLQLTDNLINNGSMQINSGASLLLSGNRSGDGTETISRDLNGNGSLSIVGLGLSDAVAEDFGADFIFRYDNVNQAFVTPEIDVDVTPGAGFFIGSNASSYTVSASGSLNSGNISIALTQGSDNFNLVANPYVASIDATEFFTANDGFLTGSAWLWNDGAANFGDARQGDYITVNSLGTAGGPVSPSNNPGGMGIKSSTDFDGSFNSFQGFFVEASAVGNLVFTPDMQIIGNNGNPSFFKPLETTSTLRLSLSGQNFSDNLLVVLNENATLEADFSMDGRKFSGNESISFYATQLNDHYAISALPLVGEEVINLPLGFDLAQAGNYALAVEELDNFSEDVSVRVHDALTGQSHNLKEISTIPFQTIAIENSRRFSLVLAPARLDVVTNTANELSEFPIRVYGTTTNLTIHQDGVNQAELAIYSIDGRSIFQDIVQFQDGQLNLTGLSLSSNNLYIAKMDGQSVKFIVR